MEESFVSECLFGEEGECLAAKAAASYQSAAEEVATLVAELTTQATFVPALEELQVQNSTLPLAFLDEHVWPTVAGLEAWVESLGLEEFFTTVYASLLLYWAQAVRFSKDSAPVVWQYAAALWSYCSQGLHFVLSKLPALDAILATARGCCNWLYDLPRHPSALRAWVWLQDAVQRGWASAKRLKVPEAQQKQLVAFLTEHKTALAIAVVVCVTLLLLIPRFKALRVFYKDARVLILGLNNSGKTTLLLLMRDKRIAIPNRTMEPMKVQLTLDSTRLHATDLGGHDTARAKYPWESFFHKSVTGVIFLVDASDTNAEKMERARRELHKVLAAEELGTVPVLVLGNKIDLDTAVSEKALRDWLRLEDWGDDRDRVHVCMCSLALKMGYGDGLRWLIHRRD